VSSECSGRVECSAQSGNILSPSFPSFYDPSINCIWVITVADNAYVQLNFIDFDVYEMDSPTCDNDRLTVTSINPYDDSETTTIAQLCNTNVPKGPLESLWNMMQLQFTTDLLLSGRGFWATYDGVQYKSKNNNGSTMGRLFFCSIGIKSYLFILVLQRLSGRVDWVYGQLLFASVDTSNNMG
jgi:hypothetical protein